MFDNLSLPTIIISYVALLFSLSVHEASHAGMAYLLDDDTAARMGRLTLNPIAHMDPLGTVIFPLMGLVFGGFFIGWAKPVPFNPAKFTRKIRVKMGDALVSVAGPASNVALALIFTIALALSIRFSEAGPQGRIYLLRAALSGPESLRMLELTVTQVALLGLGGALIKINILLALFNMIPLGPLDGAGVLRGFIPDRNLYRYDEFRYHPYMWLGLMLLMFTGVIGFFLSPMWRFLFNSLLQLAGLILGVY